MLLGWRLFTIVWLVLRSYFWLVGQLTLLLARGLVAACQLVLALAGRRQRLNRARSWLESYQSKLQILAEQFPATSEPIVWSQEAETAVEGLRGFRTGPLYTFLEQEIPQREQQLAQFAQAQAQALLARIRSEGNQELERRLGELRSQLQQPLSELTALGRSLNGVRGRLLKQVLQVEADYRAKLGEAQAAVRNLAQVRSPDDLLRELEAHLRRSELYDSFGPELTTNERQIATYLQWQEFVAEIEQAPASPGITEFDKRLSQDLRFDERQALGELESYRSEFADLLRQLHPERSPAPPPPAPTPAAAPEPEIKGDLPWIEPSPEAAPPPPTPAPQPKAAAKAPKRSPASKLQLPGLDLLDEPPPSAVDEKKLEAQTRERAQIINRALANFGLLARVGKPAVQNPNGSITEPPEVVAWARGPTVTRFEVSPGHGEKISRIAALANDMALALRAGSVRVEAPIPGKAAIGLEIPNEQRESISFRKAMSESGFLKSRAELPIILGKAIDGTYQVPDLIKMPHLLIAGSTGSGKSVCVNVIIASLLYKYLPTQLRLLLVDPKMVELTQYEGLPHLLRPVVTQPLEAAAMLQGAVAHMEHRYSIMSHAGCRNLEQLNAKIKQGQVAELDAPLPYLVIVIDELADLMITSGREVEAAIMRLAQLARATGMHLVLATQRPSVDILTSLIKVNIPARVAFAVSSSHDSRTILDAVGAETLTGRGDMLFDMPGLSKAIRLQAPFLSEAEVERLVTFLGNQPFIDQFGEQFSADFEVATPEEKGLPSAVDLHDELLRPAAELVMEDGQASVSRLQRRLRVGHARAGKLIDSLEGLGIIGPAQGSKPREVLVDSGQLDEIFTDHEAS
ncbi:MAG: DNA translocase FtsK [Deinococcus sp.]|nr:DNA translocase FtsK [Deinococcus sp.]